MGRAGAGLLVAAALLGLIDALVAYFAPGNPINYSIGTMIVAGSSLLLLIGAGLLAARRVRGGPRGFIRGLCLLDILGTGVAAFFLHAWILLALMVLALVAWGLTAAGGERRRTA